MIQLALSSTPELRCLPVPTGVKSQPCDCPVLCQTGFNEESKAQKQDLVSPSGCALLQEGRARGCLTGSPGIALGREALPAAGLEVGSLTLPRMGGGSQYSCVIALSSRGCGGEVRDKHMQWDAQ